MKTFDNLKVGESFWGYLYGDTGKQIFGKPDNVWQPTRRFIKITDKTATLCGNPWRTEISINENEEVEQFEQGKYPELFQRFI